MKPIIAEIKMYYSSQVFIYKFRQFLTFHIIKLGTKNTISTMKNRTLYFTILFLLAINITFEQGNSDSSYTFEEYEKQFGKQYSQDQRPVRKSVFEKNYQQLLQTRSKSQGQYQVRVNNFTDMTQEELAKFFSYRPLQLDMPYDPLPSKNILRSIALPQAFNYTALGKVTPVKNQKKCGSCWAYASTAMYESQLLIKAVGEYDLSQQYVLECTPQSSCEGGWPNTALHTFAQTGIPTQQTLPYNPSKQSGDTCQIQPKIKLPYEIESIKHYNEVPETQLRQILLDNGPVSVGIKANNNGFLFYGGGVFTGCQQVTQSNQIDHVLLLIGWTKQGDWIVKNSWGKSWGQMGYATISGNRNCGINKFVDVMKVSKKLIGQQLTDIQAPLSNEMETLKVKISDSFGDGWNGYVLGIRQDNSILTVFGEEFKSGSQQGPIDIQVKSGVQTEIVVAVAGKNSQEIGFSITDSQGKELCSRQSGSPFAQTIIFCTFCPSCVSSNTLTYYYTLTSKSQKGWNGNVLSIRQNGIDTSFGEQFISGYKYGPRKIHLLKRTQAQIWPYIIGTTTEDIGFQIRDSFGNLLASKASGTAFLKDTKLGSFCSGCENVFYINQDQNNYQERSPYEVTKFIDERNLIPFIVAVSILGAMVVILGGVTVFLALRLMKNNNQFLLKRDTLQSVPCETPPKSKSPQPQGQSQKHPLPSAESMIMGTVQNIDIDDSNPVDPNRFSNPNISSKAHIISTKHIN